MALPDGAFGACQVIAVGKHSVAVYLMDWHSERPPGLADITGTEPLDLDHHAHLGGLYQVTIDRDSPVPSMFTWWGLCRCPIR